MSGSFGRYTLGMEDIGGKTAKCSQTFLIFFSIWSGTDKSGESTLFSFCPLAAFG